MQLEYRTHTVLGSDESKAEAFAHLKSVGNNVCIRLVQKEEKRIFEHTMSMFPTQQCVGNINLPPDVHNGGRFIIYVVHPLPLVKL